MGADQSLMLRAAKDGDCRLAGAVIRSNPAAAKAKCYGYTALHVAAALGHVEVSPRTARSQG